MNICLQSTVIKLEMIRVTNWHLTNFKRWLQKKTMQLSNMWKAKPHSWSSSYHPKTNSSVSDLVPRHIKDFSKTGKHKFNHHSDECKRTLEKLRWKDKMSKTKAIKMEPRAKSCQHFISHQDLYTELPEQMFSVKCCQLVRFFDITIS